MEKIDLLFKEMIEQTIAQEFPELSQEKVQSIAEDNLYRLTEPVWTEFDFRLGFLLTEIQQGTHEKTTIPAEVE